MSGIEITVRDTENGDTETQTITNDYVIVTAGRYYVSGVQTHANGTHVITVRVGDS